MSFVRTSQLAQQATRAYATAAATKNVSVPLALHGIEGRYATALYTAASKKNALPQVETDLKKLKTLIEKDTKVRQFLENPILGKKAKKEGIAALAKGQSLNQVTLNFLDVLAENSRMAEASKVINSYQSLMAAHRGEVQVTVTSSKALTGDQLNKLKASLSKGNLVANAKSVTVDNKVNPSIVGGLIIEFGDKTIDMSLASKLSKLDKMLTGK
ncbi:ATP synthase F0 subcomplex subunit OSCP atp5 [Tieghemiomyces parasiticus]|uniref:ATP synthase subunit 5, mitochondrial n=1 Tax=Tieghemiomyces parasiticus TaxID=78921 RepID=A0A9W8ADI1_9FUNG|nr:ATP synthase F0 subcomplex subunit OSCP atp5 [Tieghemiomyces parasiticus]